MKSPQQWKMLLGTINFPNFNKSDDEEVMEFIFSNCKQRDALLTWIVVQLGADFDSRILKHEAIIEYLKKRRIAGNSEISEFVEATLSKFDQEVIWDKLFSFIKMQKRLIPQPYEGISHTEPPTFDNTEYNERFHDLSAKDYLEPLYKELDLLKKLRKVKPGVVEASNSVAERSFEPAKVFTEGSVDEDEQKETFMFESDNAGADDLKIIKKSEINVGEGDVRPAKKFLPTEKTLSGTWYVSPDGRQKVFVPVGAPPLGEFNFDSKSMKVVCEEDKPSTEQQVKFTEKMEALEKRFKKLMRESNEEY